jgi:hypothetical protein
MDAFDSSNGWIEIDEYKPQVCNVISVGFLWPDCLNGYITITGSYFPDELPNLKTIGMVTHIPVEMVKKVVILDQAITSTYKGRIDENKIYDH